MEKLKKNFQNFSNLLSLGVIGSQMQNTLPKQPLIPRKTINSQGRVNYSEGFQAWNVLNLKKELFEEFPQLKQKRSKFCYEIIYHRDPKEFEKAIKEMIKEGKKNVMPLLLWIYKEE